MVTIPERLAARLASEPDVGPDWLAALPATVSRLSAAWSLQLGSPIEPGGMTSIVFPAQRMGTGPRQSSGPGAAMLKIPVPEPELAGEAAGLALVGGDGAVRLLDHDPPSGALLLEAADPDRSLLDLDDADRSAAIAADLLRRWWRPVPRPEAGPPVSRPEAGPPVSRPDTRPDAPRSEIEPVRPRADGADAGAGVSATGAPVSVMDPATIPRLVDVGPLLGAVMRRRQHGLETGLDASLIDRAVATFVAPDPAADTLLHTDLHQGNVLAAQREPWLVIDPKPLVGEAAYDLEPLLRDHRGGRPSDAAIRRRFDATSAQLGLDRERAQDWVVARSVELGLWSLEAGEDVLGNHQLRVAAVLVSSPGRGR